MLTTRTILTLRATITTTIRLLLTPSVPRFTHLQKTFEKARRKPYFQGDGLNQNSWLRSGNQTNANNAYNLNTSGGNSNNNTTNTYAVRPALHSFIKNLKKARRKNRTFRATVLIRTAGCVPATITMPTIRVILIRRAAITTTIRLIRTPSVPRFTRLQKRFVRFSRILFRNA